ncbi:hypothetical protein AV530_020087 [Patagioenas fasciata monilis]|uniref:Uncharacterized protein n=1 Tax=Patagioenas fasciata monilis TaxID=372326 RepID=A0A1V4JHZ2_PATFA|nr:hypothetical protein AV530_020087 [Patagioenas fasciata monilis]
MATAARPRPGLGLALFRRPCRPRSPPGAGPGAALPSPGSLGRCPALPRTPRQPKGGVEVYTPSPKPPLTTQEAKRPFKSYSANIHRATQLLHRCGPGG